MYRNYGIQCVKKQFNCYIAFAIYIYIFIAFAIYIYIFKMFVLKMPLKT